MAHPDDPEFGAGGSVCRLADAGAEVTYVVVTDGTQGGEDPKQKDAELKLIREKEQRAAARVLGVKKVEFLGHRDGHLSHDLKLRHDIVRMIRKYKPDLVITHMPGRVLDMPMGGSHPTISQLARRPWRPSTPTRATPELFALSSRRGSRPTRSKRSGSHSGRPEITWWTSRRPWTAS
jgi:LmbE family N-acetylglucosaminyl deacetylase